MQTGTTGAEAVTKLLGKTSTGIKRFESTPLALKELEAGGVEAVVADQEFAPVHHGIAFKKGNTELQARLNKALAEIRATGTYNALFSKSFGAGLVLGVGLGLISTSRDAPPPRSALLRGLLGLAGAVKVAYVTFFRGTPLFVQILLAHFVLMPLLIHPNSGWWVAGSAARSYRQEHGAFFSGCLALSLNAGAHISEIFRAGIQSIHRGQTQAASSMGLSHGPAVRFVVLPQAFRRMVPALVNEGIALIKDSSLVSAIGLAELALAARTVAGAYSRCWEPYLAISAIYLMLTLLLSVLA